MALAPGNSYAFTVRNIAGPWQLGGYREAASLTTALSGTNNDIVWTARERGTGGNDIRIRYVVSGNNTALSVSVSTKDITVNVATDGGGAATSTADDVKAAVAASSAANLLVTSEDAASNDGSGVVAALAFTALSGGTDWVVGR